jgi:hypothetical protein
MTANVLLLLMLILLLSTPGIAWSSASCPNVSLRAGTSATLPDCRAYEQVSPIEKGGNAAVPVEPLPVTTAPSGERIAYLSRAGFFSAEGSSAAYSAHVSARTPAGWETRDWTPPIVEPQNTKVFLVDYDFSEDVSQAVIKTPFLPLAPGGIANAYNLFLRHANGTYGLIDSGPPAVPIEGFCPEPEEKFSCFEAVDISAFAGASTDYSHIAFESTAGFASGPGFLSEALYEDSPTGVRLVGILPDETAAETSTAGGGSAVRYENNDGEVDARVEHAVSQDGARIIFTAPADNGVPDPQQAGENQVYDRVNGNETVELSAPEPGSTPEDATPRPATFWAASSDGSRVLFTSAADLTTASRVGKQGGEDLYEYDFARPAGQKLHDLSVDTNTVDATSGASVLGVVGTSLDGNFVYFVADGELAPGEGADGHPNLYVVHDGGPPTFVTTLGDGDGGVWAPADREAYVTLDGRHLAFMSTAPVPTTEYPQGYDNTDAQTGNKDSEVYEYSAENRQLACASCDPGNTRPVGDAYLGGMTRLPPGPIGEVFTGTQSTPFIQVRAMNDAGTRLFYSAPSPSDASLQKVYEYERPGEGTCGESTGCRFKISGGGKGIDRFLGTSASGGDAFIATTTALSTSDRDPLRDVYDARVDGGLPKPVAGGECQEECRTPTVPPSLPVLVGSESGPSGNQPATKGTTVPSPHLTAAQLLRRALRACHRQRRGRPRKHCEGAARKSYRTHATVVASHNLKGRQ